MSQMAFWWTHFVFPSCLLVNNFCAQIAEPWALCQERGKQQIPFVGSRQCVPSSQSVILNPLPFRPLQILLWRYRTLYRCLSPCSYNRAAFFPLRLLTLRSATFNSEVPFSKISLLILCIHIFTSSLKTNKQINNHSLSHNTSVQSLKILMLLLQCIGQFMYQGRKWPCV